MPSLTGSDTSIEFVGLREVSAGLKKLGVPDAEIKQANHEVGLIVANDARSLMPTQRSGKLARTLKVNKNKNTIRVTVGNNTTVKYAYTFHAIHLGKSRGGFKFEVPAHSRKGSKRGSARANVRAYTANRYIKDNPFLHTAMVRNRDRIFTAYRDAMVRLARSVSSG